jgi:hypothetical protein
VLLLPTLQAVNKNHKTKRNPNQNKTRQKSKYCGFRRIIIFCV